MAEPLKDSFGPDVAERIGTMIQAVQPDFDKARFLALALEGFQELELTDRARRLSRALAETLPPDPEKAIRVLVESVDLGLGERTLRGMESFLLLPHTYFVAERGLECFETSMWAQHKLTRRFTAEFSIRPILDRFPEKTLDRLRIWARDADPRVRRLVSEGTRPGCPGPHDWTGSGWTRVPSSASWSFSGTIRTGTFDGRWRTI